MSDLKDFINIDSILEELYLEYYKELMDGSYDENYIRKTFIEYVKESPYPETDQVNQEPPDGDFFMRNINRARKVRSNILFELLMKQETGVTPIYKEEDLLYLCNTFLTVLYKFFFYYQKIQKKKKHRRKCYKENKKERKRKHKWWERVDTSCLD